MPDQVFNGQWRNRCQDSNVPTMRLITWVNKWPQVHLLFIQNGRWV